MTLKFFGVKTMKKYILSPLCSALVIPGLGQIINQDLKKGLTLLSVVFILFIAGTVKLSLTVKSMLTGPGHSRLNSKVIMERLQGEDFSILWFLLLAFAIVWVYSVLDAFWRGKKLEGQTEDDIE
jgi:uncharacterized membrane protein